MLDHALLFLTNCPPFSFLPEPQMRPLAERLTMEYHPRGSLLFVQGQSIFDHICLIQQGALEVYDEQDGQETHQDLLGQGEHCGGVAILHNEGLALRNVRTAEDSFLYLLPKQEFLQLCAEHEDVRAYFTDLFGKRMLDRSQALLRHKRLQSMTRQEAMLCTVTVAQVCAPDPLSCPPETSIREAASRMRDHQQNAILIQEAGDQQACIGIVTDHDLRCKVLAAGLDPSRPIRDIMSTPVMRIGESEHAMTAVMVMMEHRVKHLVVTTEAGNVCGLLSDQSLLLAQGQSPIYLLRQIRQIQLLRDLTRIRPIVPRLVRSLSMEGVPVESLTEIITRLTDATLRRILELVQAELGPPPCRFAWVCMGSEGRREQTLATDQDNALIYEDLPESKHRQAEAYFEHFANHVCTALHESGYHYCPGKVMASNPKWRQPLDVWKEYFRSWIQAPEPLAVMQSNIFFDLRCGFGDATLVASLRDDLKQHLAKRAGIFFYHLALNACRNTPPLGLFRNIVVERKGEHENALDIKKPIMAIVDFARIYALRSGLSQTNTLDRLKELGRQEILKPGAAQEVQQAYSWLMQHRFERQEAAILEEDREADNFIYPQRLSNMEQRILKETFRLIERLQLKLKLDFTGST